MILITAQAATLTVITEEVARVMGKGAIAISMLS